MSLIELMRNRIAELDATRQERQAALDAINEAAEARGDGALTEEESEQLASVLEELRSINEDRKAAQARLDALEEEARNRAEADANARRIVGESHTRVVDDSNERTYTRGAERRGVSFLRDLVLRANDPRADERIRQHMREVDADGVEVRDVGTGAFAGLVVPQYLTDLVAPVRRAGRPTADIANSHELPPDGMTVNISRITTGTSAAIQATENAGVSETDADDTLLTVNVRTIAGQQDVSRQAIERGTGIDAVVIEDLVRAYNTNLDSGILNDDGTSGTHLGIRNVSGNVAVTYTDTNPTAAELYPKLADLIQQVQTGVFMGVSHFIMHPRRWWWIASQVGTSLPFLNVPGVSTEQAGNLGGTAYEAMNRQILGVPVVLDANLPTNLGTGTDEDTILGVTASELHLWEDPSAPLLIRAEQTAAGNLTVKFVVYGFSAFTAGRYPAAHGDITGTGLVAPTF